MASNLVSEQELFFTTAEVKLKNRFRLIVDGIPSFIIRVGARPKMKSNVITLPHINVDRKVKGKTTWDPISITLTDYIVPSGAQAVMEWIRLGHESVTGRDGYADFYKKDVIINTLGPVGDIVEQWLLKGAFPSDADFGDMDWSKDEPMEITLTLNYDYAILEF